MDRLFNNYFVKSEINKFYNNLSCINTENICAMRQKYFDLKHQLNNVEFIFFDRIQHNKLSKQLNLIVKKFIEVELEEEITKENIKFQELASI